MHVVHVSNALGEAQALGTGGDMPRKIPVGPVHRMVFDHQPVISLCLPRK